MKGVSRKVVGFGALLFLSGAALAAAIIIRASDENYGNLSNVRSTSIASEVEIRAAGLSQAAVRYRQISGQSSLPVGSEFTMVWNDGSSERGSINSRTSSLGATPIPGSQRGPVGGCGAHVVCLPH
jgi:hypothetical protein